MPQTVASLIERWAQAQPAERANAQLYISELCDALGMDRPRPAGTGYQFELPERLVALHDERVAEEKAGTVPWLRPEYQIPRLECANS